MSTFLSLLNSIIVFSLNPIIVSFSSIVENVEERLGQDKAYIIDSSKVRNKLKWKPKVPIDQGLQQTINWVEEFFEDILQQPLNYIHKE